MDNSAKNASSSVKLVIGIDASNIRGGGGVTHLKEILAAATPEKSNISRVIVWAGSATLCQLEERYWLKKINPSALDKGLMRRAFWQKYELAKAAKIESCDLLFIPGGSFATKFRPIVTMSQNMLPFEWKELSRYGVSWLSVKMLLLRYFQSTSFLQADGVIFLTAYAKEQVEHITGSLPGKSKIIPHGVNCRFASTAKVQCSLEHYSNDKPLRIIYVSIIDLYKHQWNVVKAISNLHKSGMPVFLDLIGPAYLPALKRLKKVIAESHSENVCVRYHGEVPYEELGQRYADADIGIFASSCENMPNILIENMTAGLPIACSDSGPMPEVLGDGGVYFNPEDPESITQVLRELILSPEMRTALIEKSQQQSAQYSWERCADETFEFLFEVYTGYKEKDGNVLYPSR